MPIDAEARLPRQATFTMVRTLAKTVERVEPNTAGHLAATARFAVVLARRLRFRPAAVRVIHLGAMLHDVGKVGVPPTLLLRQGSLSSREFALVQEHPMIGWEIATTARLDPAIATIVRQHHERLDGSGYPDRLSNGAIMAEAMVVAIADEVHALAARRSYRPGMAAEAIAQILDADGDSRLPRRYVDAAIDLVWEQAVH